MAITTRLLVATKDLQQYLVDKATGEALAAGVVTCYQDNNRALLKNWYYQTGTPGAYSYLALANPLTLSASGTVTDPSGNDTIPFYYPYDEDNQTPQPYYITVENSEGTLQFTRENWPFSPITPENTSVPALENLIINNRFWRNIGNTTLTNETDIVVAPSQHDGFRMPDIRFKKSATGATDTMQFLQFALGEDPFSHQTDIPGQYYIHHTCSAATTGETFKYYQFPITLHLRTLQLVGGTVSIEARNVSGASNNLLNVSILKDPGTNASGSSELVVIQDHALTDDWSKITGSFTFPNPSGLTLSNGDDDAYYLLVKLPTDATFNWQFCLPSVYLSTTIPTNDFQTFDQIDPIINGFRTGDVRQSLNAQMLGWVPCNGGTIGSTGASSATSRSNNDTWPLYNLIWNNIPDLFAPVGGGRGASAYVDFDANKLMTLPITLGQVLVGAAPTFATDSVFSVNITTAASTGNDTAADTITFASIGDLLTGDILQVDTTAYGLTADTNYYIGVTAGTTLAFYLSLYNAANDVDRVDITGVYGAAINIKNTDLSITLSTAPSQILITGTPVIFNQVGTLPGGLSTGTIYYINDRSTTITKYKLSSSYENAELGYAINFTSSGSGANTVQSALGGETGESDHRITESELAAHTHTFSSDDDFLTNATAFESRGTGPAIASYLPVSGTTNSTGDNKAMNLIQRSVFTNTFLKL
jgi:hypothetical protein